MKTLFENARNFFSPIKFFSFMIIIIGLVDGFSIDFGLLSGVNYFINLLIRIFFFSVAFFGIFGNGKTKRIRATVVSLPFLYFGFYNFILLIQNNQVYHTLSIFIALMLGIWMLLFGDFYE